MHHHFGGLRVLVIFSLFFIMGFGTHSLRAQDRGPIQRIDVQGNIRVDTQAILSHLSFKSGNVLSEQAMNQALKELYAMGLFQDVSLERVGHSLQIRVVENPIINRLVFEGNDKISDEDLKAEVGLKPREIYAQDRIKEATRKILQLYRLKGKFSAKVVPKKIQKPDNRLDIVFEIDEGPTIEISRILFVGNKAFSDSQLKSVLSTKETRWYRFFSSDDNYDPARLDYDKELLRQYYRSQGFADCDIISAGAEFSPANNVFFITFTLQEGKRYQFGNVDLVSDVISAKQVEALRRNITAETGQWFNDKEIERTIANILRDMGQKKVYFSDVVPETKRDTDKEGNPVIHITFRIVKVPPVYIEKIHITGNTGTDDEVIRRELLCGEGDAFNNSELERSKRNIENLDFFKFVDFDVKEADMPDRKDLHVKVEEKPTGEFMIGGGYATSEGILGDFRAKERNFMGRGQEVDFHVTASKRSKSILLGFTEPHFLKRRLQAGVDVFATRYKQDTKGNFSGGYTSKDIGTGLRLGYVLQDDLFQVWNYTIKKEDIGGVDSKSPFLQETKGKYTVSSVGQALIYDKRNSAIAPCEGYRIELSNDYTGLGGNVDYFGTAISGKWYHPLNADRDIVFNVRSKYKFLMKTGKKLRTVDHYFSGFTEFQGFDQSGVGPRDKITEDALGGKQYFYTTCEVYFPLGLPKEFDLKGGIFTTWGSVWDHTKVDAALKDRIASNKFSIRGTAGFEVIIRLPMVTAVVGWAKTIKYVKGVDQRKAFFFRFGTEY